MQGLRIGPKGKGSLAGLRASLHRDGYAPASAATSPAFTQPPLPVPELREIATRIRCDIVRMTGAAGSGHPGGSLSAADIVTVLYFSVMRHDPENPYWPDRDRFILSKGHGAPVLYAALAESGYFPQEDLIGLRKLDSHLQGHPDMTSTPGVEASTGSLGQGLSVAIGHALAARLDGRDYRVHVLVGCGECDEGQIWEAAMFAGHHRLDNLVAIVDYNHMQIDGRNEEILNLDPLPDKWRAFGWHTLEVDGHDLTQLLAAFETAKEAKGKPTAIIAQTVKGKGVAFMENVVDFHGKAPSGEQVEAALKDLGEADKPATR